MKEIHDLQAAVEQYYGIGLGDAKRELIASIVSRKINDIISGTETDWSQLVSVLKKSNPTIDFENVDYHQFPSNQLQVNLKTDGFQFGRHRSRFILTQSLLCPYFTSFIHEEFIYDVYEPESPPKFSIIRPVPHDSEYLVRIQSILHESIKAKFSSYFYLAPSLLLFRRVSDVSPYPDYASLEPTANHSTYYQLLFDSGLMYYNLSILS